MYKNKISYYLDEIQELKPIVLIYSDIPHVFKEMCDKMSELLNITDIDESELALVTAARAKWHDELIDSK